MKTLMSHFDVIVEIAQSHLRSTTRVSLGVPPFIRYLSFPATFITGFLLGFMLFWPSPNFDIYQILNGRGKQFSYLAFAFSLTIMMNIFVLGIPAATSHTELELVLGSPTSVRCYLTGTVVGLIPGLFLSIIGAWGIILSFSIINSVPLFNVLIACFFMTVLGICSAWIISPLVAQFCLRPIVENNPQVVSRNQWLILSGVSSIFILPLIVILTLPSTISEMLLDFTPLGWGGELFHFLLRKQVPLSQFPLLNFSLVCLLFGGILVFSWYFFPQFMDIGPTHPEIPSASFSAKLIPLLTFPIKSTFLGVITQAMFLNHLRKGEGIIQRFWLLIPLAIVYTVFPSFISISEESSERFIQAISLCSIPLILASKVVQDTISIMIGEQDWVWTYRGAPRGVTQVCWSTIYVNLSLNLPLCFGVGVIVFVLSNQMVLWSFISLAIAFSSVVFVSAWGICILGLYGVRRFITSTFPFPYSINQLIFNGPPVAIISAILIITFGFLVENPLKAGLIFIFLMWSVTYVLLKIGQNQLSFKESSYG